MIPNAIKNNKGVQSHNNEGLISQLAQRGNFSYIGQFHIRPIEKWSDG